MTTRVNKIREHQIKNINKMGEPIQQKKQIYMESLSLRGNLRPIVNKFF